MSNKDLPFDLVSLSSDDVQSLEDTYQALCAKFNVGPSGDNDIHLEKFDIFNNNPNISIGGTLLIKTPANNCHLAFLRIHYSNYGLKSVTRYDYYKYQVWAFITLNKDFGQVLIRHETFNDKIVGLLHPCELNFKDDKEFDRKFYVVTNDEQKALLAMNWNFRNAVMDMGHSMMLETMGNSIIIGNNMSVDVEQTIELAEFACKIAALK
jgi:hypothetical protein